MLQAWCMSDVWCGLCQIGNVSIAEWMPFMCSVLHTWLSLGGEGGEPGQSHKCPLLPCCHAVSLRHVATLRRSIVWTVGNH